MGKLGHFPECVERGLFDIPQPDIPQPRNKAKACVFRSQLTGNPESREHAVRKIVNTWSGKS